MKFLALLVVMATLSYAGAKSYAEAEAVAVASPTTTTHSRGCIYVNGRCYKECEEGTHAYAIGCGYMTPEPTCTQPNPVEDKRGMICDYSACYCDEGTLRDTISNTCVPHHQCPKTDKI